MHAPRFRGAVPLATVLALAGAGCGGPKVDYQGLQLVRPRSERPTGGDVERFLDQIRAQAATARPLGPGRALKMGDRAVIDFEGSVDGKLFPGGSGSGVPVILGSGQMIPGFEAGLAGMTEGQVKVINVTFPQDYQEASLAGKAATFKLTVRHGEALSRPPLDDALAAKVSGGRMTSAAELRKAAREQLYQGRLQQAEQRLRQQAALLLVAQWTKEPGRRRVNQELDRVVQQLLSQASQRGAGPAQGGPDAEKLRATNREIVVRALKMQDVMAQIAKREGLNVGDAEVEQAAGRMAQAQGQDPQAALSYLRENKLLDVVRRQVLEERVMNAVLQQARITEAPQPPQR